MMAPAGPSCYAGAVIRLAIVGLAAVVLLTGCRMFSDPKKYVDQRTTQGPTADDFWTARVVMQTGRSPNFEEKRHYHDELDRTISAYLRENEAAASDMLTLQAFRFLHQVTAGMQKQQVAILLGIPLSSSIDPAQMQSWARRHWPDLRGRTDEAWVYPFGWTVYFDKGKVVELTQYTLDEP
jgi:hypothetical protein